MISFRAVLFDLETEDFLFLTQNIQESEEHGGIDVEKSAYHHLSMKCHRHVRYELDKSEKEIKNGELR